VELELGFDHKYGDLGVEVFGNLSYTENEVTFISDDKTFVPGQRYGPQGLEITRYSVGEPIGYLFGYKTDGLFQNQGEIDSYTNADGTPMQPEAQPGDFKFVDFNNDGIIDDEDRTKIGDPTPSWTYGATAKVDWKGFDVVLFGQGVWGNDVYNATRRFDLNKSNWNAAALGRWTGEGSTNEFPRMTLLDANRNYSRSSDFFVQNGAFFRIKTLQIGYTLPRDILDRMKFQELRVYISGNNLYTITKYQGFDPEIGGGSIGVDRGIYPQARYYLVGVNATF